MESDNIEETDLDDKGFVSFTKEDWEKLLSYLKDKFGSRVVDEYEKESPAYTNKDSWFIQVKTSWDYNANSGNDRTSNYKNGDSIHYEVIKEEDKQKVRVELHLEWNDEKRERKLFEYLKKKTDESKWERWGSRDSSQRYIAARNIKNYQEVINHFNELIKTFDDIILQYKRIMITESVRLLKRKRNLILAGAPGVGKTFNTAEIALKVLGVEDVDFDSHEAVMERYKSLLPKPKVKDESGKKVKDKKDNPRIFFTTFHQSLDYEDFVEGMRPEPKEGGVTYGNEDGIFKKACKAAKEQKVVLIIDEINRGNVSKIFGELITLIEADKRENGEHPIEAILPYSGDPFVVPSELYIIGTMNTTDRSTGTLDYALRRRFAFYTLKSDINVVKDHYHSNDELGGKAVALFENIENFINSNSCGDYDVDDLMVGHSYFMAKDEGELRDKMKYEVIPLIKEYMNDGILNVDKKKANEVFNKWLVLEPANI